MGLGLLAIVLTDGILVIIILLARAMWKIIRLGSRGRLAWRDRTFGEFLEECQQPEALVRRFWNAIVVSACNLDVTRVLDEFLDTAGYASSVGDESAGRGQACLRRETAGPFD